MAMGYARSRALCAAARLEIADCLDGGEKSVTQLALACRADEASLFRLLRALASFGIVCETASSKFVLTPLGAPLQKGRLTRLGPPLSFGRTCSPISGPI